MKNTEGCRSFITFLNVFNFGLRPAELTPKNLKDLTKHFLLFLFPLLPFRRFFLMLILTSFLLNVLFAGSFSDVDFLWEVPCSAEPCKKTKMMAAF